MGNEWEDRMSTAETRIDRLENAQKLFIRKNDLVDEIRDYIGDVVRDVVAEILKPMAETYTRLVSDKAENVWLKKIALWLTVYCLALTAVSGTAGIFVWLVKSAMSATGH